MRWDPNFKPMLFAPIRDPRPTIHTNSGKVIYYDRPHDSEFCIFDIARALSRICRYGGHIKDGLPGYSVAEHSVRVSELCSIPFAFAGLLHDAAEAYIGDVVGPLKAMPEMFHFRELERRMEEAIGAFFDVSLTPMNAGVKAADMIMLHTEQRDVRDLYSSPRYLSRVRPDNYAMALPNPIEPWTPELAEERFLDRFNETQRWKR